MKHLRLLTAALAVIFALGASAWDGSDGKVYLRNVGSGLWWGAGNSWSTQASLLKHPEYVTLHKQDNGTYQMESQVSNGGTSYYFNGSYMDKPSPVNLTFTSVGAGQYTIGDGSIFYGYDGESTVLATGADDRQDNFKWQVYSYDDMVALFSTATEDNPVDATFLILNPNFGRNNRNTGVWTMDSSNKNLCGGSDENRCAESWQAAFTLSQTISNAPNGIYRLRAQAALTDYTNAYDGTDYPVVYINDATTPFKNMEGADIGSDMATLSASFSNGKYFTDYTENVAVLDGKIVVGVKGTRTDTWCIWDNFELQYLGPIVDLTPYIEAYKAALAAAKATAGTEDKIAPSVLTALNNAINANDEGKVDEASQEALETATAALKAANDLANTSINSYKIIASGVVPSDNLAGWTCTNNNTFHINTWSTEGNNDGTGMTTPFIENWVSSANVLGDGQVYYTLAGLEPGEIYFASALVRAYSEAGNVPNGPDFFINDAVIDMTSEGKAFEYTDRNGFKSGYYGTLSGSAIVGEDGKLVLGVTISEANYNWVAFKNISITTVEQALQIAYDKVKAYSGKVNAAAQAEIDNIEAATEAAYDLKTVAGVEAAIQALNEKAEKLGEIAIAYEEFNTIYPQVKALCDVADYKELVANAHKTLADALTTLKDNVEATTSAAEMFAFNSELKAAGTQYAKDAEPTGDAKFNLTFMLVNANLEGLPTWQGAEGWYTDQTDGNSQVMTNPDATSEDGTKTAFYEYWSESPKANGEFTLYQKVNLGAGIYNMSCYAFAQQPIGGEVRGVKFFANDTEGSTIQSNRLAPASIEFVNAEEGEVKIGLKAMEGNTYRWMGIGYVELYKLPFVKEASIADNDTEAPEAGAYTAINADVKLLAGLNTLVLPFATTKAEIGADMVFAYSGSEKRGDNLYLTFTETETLSANTPYIVKMAADKALPSFENKTVAEKTNLTVADANGQYDFVGTYTAYAKGTSPIVAGDYIAGAENIVKANGGNGIKAYRAYLKKVGDENISYVALEMNGEVIDGIEALEMFNALTGDIYNLNGQKVNKAQKGVYIINGQKVVVK